jgi:5-methyltetrahydropteroyltriglutamate--homocysteine methyltransferase
MSFLGRDVKMETTIIGFPRIGAQRELKFVTEKYFRGKVSIDSLNETACNLRKKHWLLQKNSGLNLIPVNDFSLYDTTLDTAVLFNVIPRRYHRLGLNPLDTYFAMARGYQGVHGDVKALAMKKWFNTNYHYMVPELEDDMNIKLTGTKIIDECKEALALKLLAKPVILGPFTFLQLARCTGKKTKRDFADVLTNAYKELLTVLEKLGITWLSVEEPLLVTDLSQEDLSLFADIYRDILQNKQGVQILCQTYFGDVRDCYHILTALDFDGIGLDFLEGKETLSTLCANGFPEDKILFAGVVNGKNIWRNNYTATLTLLKKIQSKARYIVLNSSCSLLHVPFTITQEIHLNKKYLLHFSFAEEKLQELSDLKKLMDSTEPKMEKIYKNNVALFAVPHAVPDAMVQKRVACLTKKDFTRHPGFTERENLQKKTFHFPLLPTTTIGSFPQTLAVRKNRADYRNNKISLETYKNFNKKQIAACIALQEKIGLDVLVHGEFERNDMVEYFGEHLNGFIFTENAWVQSYGTRCVKPPIIWSDVSRRKSITVEWSTYAQQLTNKPVKGMLTGPVTILNWSFPREDIALRESTIQIALAIRDEVLDLEKHGIRIIQIDEAALREKLPLRKADWHTNYLDWAIPAFRLVHSGVKVETQIHTHMCYSEFNDIIKDIDNMDADVITFEASRSDFTVLDALQAAEFRTEVGPGVYDIHSPRVPSELEIEKSLKVMLTKIVPQKLWVNPDCGLKTRSIIETKASLEHLVSAAIQVRKTMDSK